MIIYQVLPNRAFPYIISSLIKEDVTSKQSLFFDHNIKYFTQSFQFSEIFHCKDLNELEKMYTYQTQVVRFHPDKKLPRTFKEIHHQRYYEYIRFDNKMICNLTEQEKDTEINLLYGLFSSDKLKDFRKENDFSFTFIDNPIDSVYNLYKYLNYVYSLGFEEFKDDYYNSENLIGEIGFEARNYVHYYELFYRNNTLEKFIDSFINSNGRFIFNFFYFPISIYEEGTGRLSKLYKDHNFYGLVNTKENLIKSIKTFNEFEIFKTLNFKIDIKLFQTYFETDRPQKDHTYRRQDLESLMKDDVLFFKEKEKELNGT